MQQTYPEYFSNERVLRTAALAAGIAPKRARALAADLAAHPVSRNTAAKLLTHMLGEAWRRRDHAQVQRVKDLILARFTHEENDGA